MDCCSLTYDGSTPSPHGMFIYFFIYTNLSFKFRLNHDDDDQPLRVYQTAISTPCQATLTCPTIQWWVKLLWKRQMQQQQQGRNRVAGARDATRLKPLVLLLFLSFLIQYWWLFTTLDSTMPTMGKWRSMGLEMSLGMIYFIFIIYLLIFHRTAYDHLEGAWTNSRDTEIIGGLRVEAQDRHHVIVVSWYLN